MTPSMDTCAPTMIFRIGHSPRFEPGHHPRCMRRTDSTELLLDRERHRRQISSTVQESRDEDAVGTNAIDQPIPIDEELSDRLFAILGHDATTIWKLEQRVRR